MKNLIVPVVLLILFVTSHANSQRTLPFHIASDDRTAKFSFSGWTVMGKFDGTIDISTEGRKQRLKIRLTGGELTTKFPPKTVLSIMPFLARRSDKTFTRAVMANKMSIDKTLDAGGPIKLEPYEFLIETDAGDDLSKYWLAFEISFKCEHTECTTYAHSRGDIFK